MYYCDANAHVVTMTNCPVSEAFSLLVEKHAGTKQTLTTYTVGTPKTYSRNYYATSGWGAWYRIYTTVDAPTAISGNAGTATKLATAGTIALTGGVTGSASFDGSANASIATTVVSAPKLTTARTIGLSGVTATATSFDGSANITIPVTAVPATLLTGTIAAARLSGSYDISVTGSSATTSSIKNTQNDSNLNMWVGTQAQYDAITTKNDDTIYHII
ncbi:MAG: pyocin knob domain-containing protein [Tannerellaceae bacterium]|nr:pyocin knob domain-containing protein [Tannerellaceae bacterium]